MSVSNMQKNEDERCPMPMIDGVLMSAMRSPLLM